MKITVSKDYRELSQLAAACLKDVIREKKNAVIGLPTGSTPVGMYEELSGEYLRRNITFSDVVTFNLDEYIGLPETDENSYYYFMDSHFFSKVDILRKNINIPNGDTRNIEEECHMYEDKLKAAGGMDILFLGIGQNGHIGFNEPEDYFEPYTHKVDLEKSTIYANSRFFKSVGLVPASAITMGIKTILSAKRIVLLVSGDEKARILKSAVYGRITPQIPASILQLHSNIQVIADRSAAKYL